MYEAAYKNNAIAVSGSNQEVGVMGWFTGGGHGPLSTTYGHGADNVLQATVITTDGELVVANECQNSDLFWALRGGGGGTFGVVTEVVMKAYPQTNAACQSLAMHTTDKTNTTGFFDTMAYIYSELPRLKEGGMSGYSFAWGPPVYPQWYYTYGFCIWGKPNGTAEALFQPIKQYLDRQGGTINYTTEVKNYPTFYQAWNASIGFEPVAGGGITVGSRLLPAGSFVGNQANVARTLQTIGNAAPTIQGYFVANSNNRGLNISMNPAWRDATVHMIVGSGFQDTASPKQQKDVYDLTTYYLTSHLKSLAPDSGAYLNEVSRRHSFSTIWHRANVYSFRVIHMTRTGNTPSGDPTTRVCDPSRSIMILIQCCGASAVWVVRSGRRNRVASCAGMRGRIERER